MAEISIKTLSCPSCGKALDPDQAQSVLKGELVKCPYCDNPLYANKSESGVERGYGIAQGIDQFNKENIDNELARRIQIEKEAARAYAAEKRKVEEEEKYHTSRYDAEQQQMLLEEQQKFREEQAVLQKKHKKRLLIFSLIAYPLGVGLAFLIAHEFLWFIFAPKSGTPTPWIFKNEDVVTTIFGVLVAIFMGLGPIIGIIVAIKCDNKSFMFIVLWIWIWVAIFTFILYAQYNDLTFKESIDEIFGKFFKSKSYQARERVIDPANIYRPQK